MSPSVCIIMNLAPLADRELSQLAALRQAWILRRQSCTADFQVYQYPSESFHLATIFGCGFAALRCIAGFQTRERRAFSTPCRFGNRRYGRFGNLRYAGFASVRLNSYEISKLAGPSGQTKAAATSRALRIETNHALYGNNPGVPAGSWRSLHGLSAAHWDHEPATDRSADSLVREFRDSGSRGHGCPRSEPWFMERTFKTHTLAVLQDSLIRRFVLLFAVTRECRHGNRGARSDCAHHAATSEIVRRGNHPRRPRPGRF